MPEHNEGQPTEPPKKIESQPVTLDDMLATAGKLYKGLIELSNQKKLSIKKPEEVRTMYQKDVSDHEVVKAPGGRTYFIDLENAKNGTPYLKITESHFDKSSSKSIRNTIIVFKEGIQDFAETIYSIAAKIEK